MQNVVAVIVLLAIALGLRSGGSIARPHAADLHPRRPDHPGDDRRRRRDRAARPGVRGGPLRRHRRGVRRQRPRRPAAEPSIRPSSGACSPSCGGPTSRSSRRSCATCRSASTSTSRRAFPNIYFRKLAPRGELPAMDLEAEDATFGLRTLQDLGWKDLLDGFTCTECGRCQEACPANCTGKPLNPKETDHGHPAHVRRRRARAQPHPELARSCATPTASTTRLPARSARPARSSTTRSRTTPSGTA